MQFFAGPSWNTARPRSTRPDLIKEAKRIAEAILRLGHALYHDPARVFFEDQAHMPHFLGDRLFRNSDYPNVEQIKRLTAELRELGEKRIRLAELHSRDCCVSVYGKLPLTPRPSCCPPPRYRLERHSQGSNHT